MICSCGAHMHMFTSTNDLAQKEKEDLEEISSELELVDEEDKVPYVLILNPPSYV